jgi:hypothetical protein
MRYNFYIYKRKLSYLMESSRRKRKKGGRKKEGSKQGRVNIK